jgi:hypothetical protein
MAHSAAAILKRVCHQSIGFGLRSFRFAALDGPFPVGYPALRLRKVDQRR